MQAVLATWYRIHYWLMLVFSGVVVVVCLITISIPALHALQHRLNITVMLLVLAAFCLAYLSAPYQWVRKLNPLLAITIGSMLFALLILNGLAINNSYAIDLIYIFGWLILAVFSGLYNLSALLGFVFISIAYTLIGSHFQIKQFSIDDLIIIGTAGVAITAFKFWSQLIQKTRVHQSTGLTRMLRTNQQQSEIIIQSIADGVIVFDTTYTITLINQAAAKLTEWDIKDATGIDIRLVLQLTPQNKNQPVDNSDMFSKALHDQQSINQTMVLTGNKKKSTIVSVVISPILIPPENQVLGAVVVFRDVTEERKAEQQRSDFISTASHEMRTPIASIEGYLALALNDKVSNIDSKTRSFLEKAHQSTQNLGRLFQDLLTSSNAEDGRLNSHPVDVEMGVLLEQLAEDLRVSASKKNLATEFRIGSNETSNMSAESKVIRPLYYVHADPIQIREVITNLLDNAIKYTSQGKITLNITGNDSTVQFYVRDTGTGIPAEDVTHLFQKFYRVDNSVTRQVGGTGLGLFISRKIIELNGGHIWVESELGKGSTFFVNIPRVRTNSSDQIKKSTIKPLATVEPKRA